MSDAIVAIARHAGERVRQVVERIEASPEVPLKVVVMRHGRRVDRRPPPKDGGTDPDTEAKSTVGRIGAERAAPHRARRDRVR